MNPIRRWLTARAIESRVRLPGEVSCVSRISWALASSPGDAPALSSTTQASNGTIRAMVQGGVDVSCISTVYYPGLGPS